MIDLSEIAARLRLLANRIEKVDQEEMEPRAKVTALQHIFWDSWDISIKELQKHLQHAKNAARSL